jgi:outer membrane receptor for ferric coprogen and ferric-rhodotorulic acid
VTSSSLEGYRTQSSASGLGFTLPIEKVPIPLMVLPPRFLADGGGVKVEDALRYVSGVSNTGRSFGTENFAIRGFSTGNVLRDGEPFNSSKTRIPCASTFSPRIARKSPAATPVSASTGRMSPTPISATAAATS